MPKTKDYEKMTADEIDVEIIALSNERDEVRDRQLEATAAYDRKRSEEEAARRSSVMSDPEKIALFQQLQAEGIESLSDQAMADGGNE